MLKKEAKYSIDSSFLMDCGFGCYMKKNDGKLYRMHSKKLYEKETLCTAVFKA